MTFDAGVDLRRLLEQAREISNTAGRKPGKSLHPIGIGVKTRMAYATREGSFLLPDKGPGLGRLAEVVKRNVLTLHSDFSSMAWRTLFDDPQFVVPLEAPTSADCLREQIVAQVEPEALRRILLGVSLRHPGEQLQDGVVSDARVAGIATLTYQYKAKTQFVEDAWVSASWHSSTLALLQGLEAYAGSLHQRSGSTSALLLIDAASVPWEAVDEAALTRIAALVGMELTVEWVTGDRQGTVLGALKAQPPRHLFLIEPNASVAAAAAEFDSLPGNPEKSATLHFSHSPVLMTDLRDLIVSTAQVDPALRPLAAVAPQEVSTPSVLPFTPTKCLHHGSTSHRYVLDPDTDLWWTKDTAGHGGCTFKQYRIQGTLLVHVHDLDENRQVMTKTKGERLMSIPLPDLHRCPNPTSHF